jgi:hypothetical protein
VKARGLAIKKLLVNFAFDADDNKASLSFGIAPLRLNIGVSRA